MTPAECRSEARTPSISHKSIYPIPCVPSRALSLYASKSAYQLIINLFNTKLQSVTATGATIDVLLLRGFDAVYVN
jgi:hypothetical protein